MASLILGGAGEGQGRGGAGAGEGQGRGRGGAGKGQGRGRGGAGEGQGQGRENRSEILWYKITVQVSPLLCGTWVGRHSVTSPHLLHARIKSHNIRMC